MLKKLLPHTTDFFKFFEEHCALSIQGAKELVSLAEPGANIITIVARIKEIEHEADTLTHNCITELQKTFITPFDRSQILDLIRKLDDVMDSINDAASRIALYEIKEIRSEAKILAQIIAEATLRMSEALKLMRNLKNDQAIRDLCIKINRLENDGDETLRAGLRRLFAEQTHPYLVIQWKEILEHLEKATDRCEDAADIMQGVVLEAS